MDRLLRIIGLIAILGLCLALSPAQLHKCGPGDVTDPRAKVMFGGGAVQNKQAETGAACTGEIGNTAATATLSIGRVTRITHTKFTTISAGSVQYAHIKINDGNSCTFCVSLFDAAGNELLSGSADGGDGVDGWLNIDCGGTAELAAATDYYLGVDPTGGSATPYVYRAAGGNGIYYDTVAGYSCGQDMNPEETLVAGAVQLSIVFDCSAGDPS